MIKKTEIVLEKPVRVIQRIHKVGMWIRDAKGDDHWITYSRKQQND